MAQIRRLITAVGDVRYDVRTRMNGRVVTRTFRRRKDADACANSVEVDKLRGVAVDPLLGRITVEEWCRTWFAERHNLCPKTRQLYRYLLDSYVVPGLGQVELGKLTTAIVRSWHAALYERRPSIAPKAYQVLRACLNTAVEDGRLAVNPCRVKGAGQAQHAERPVAAIAEAEALANAVDERWRSMVLLAFWCSLRLGEIRALRRRDVDPLHGWVEVREQIVEVNGLLLAGPLKTAAGRRRVAIPPHVLSELSGHLERFVGPGAEDFLFTGQHGAAPLPSASFRRAWAEARRATGLGHIRFHDLRHAGNTLAAATGASTRELMARMGHSTPRAALIYQHATSDRDQAIAVALSEVATARRPLVTRDERAMVVRSNKKAPGSPGA